MTLAPQSTGAATTATADPRDAAIDVLLALLGRQVEIGRRLEQHTKSLYASYRELTRLLNFASEMRRSRHLKAEREAYELVRTQVREIVAAEFTPLDWPDLDALKAEYLGDAK